MKLILDQNLLISTPCPSRLVQKIAHEKLMEVNKEYSTQTDLLTNTTVIKCENMPKDSLICGIKWIRLDMKEG